MAVAQPLKIDVEITGTCQTCKHWGITAYIDDDGRRDCALVTSRWKSFIRNEVIPDYPNSKAVIDIPHEVYNTHLMTTPDFGCNQHEPKETEAAKEHH